jgi:hypothetical protein
MVLAIPSQAYAATNDKLVAGGSFTLEDGETLEDDLVLMGGNATLEKGSLLDGNILVMGGRLEVDGTVTGDITALGGYIELGSSAVIEGSVNSAGGYIDRASGAVVEGSLNNQWGDWFDGVVPNVTVPNVTVPYLGGNFPWVEMRFNPVVDILWYLLRIVLWALLAMLVVMLLPQPTKRIAVAATKQPLVSGGLGCLTAIVAPLVIFVLAITICLLPVSLVGVLLLIIAWALGIVSLGMVLGERLEQVFKKDWHPALSAGAGTFLLILVIDGIEMVLPCVGWIPQAVAAVLGLGAATITLLGSRSYPENGTPAEVIEQLPPSPEDSGTVEELPTASMEEIPAEEIVETTDDSSEPAGSGETQ